MEAQGSHNPLQRHPKRDPKNGACFVEKKVRKGLPKRLKEHLEKAGLKNITIKERKGVGEVIAPHYEIKIGNETIAFIYKPIGCHSYNVVNYNGTKVRIATIDTMLSFYLAFTYVDRPYYDVNRILCMAQFLFTVQQKNRLEQLVYPTSKNITN